MAFLKKHLITCSYDFHRKSESICDSGFDCLLRLENMPELYGVNNISFLSVLETYLFLRSVYKYNWHSYQACLLGGMGE